MWKIGKGAARPSRRPARLMEELEPRVLFNAVPDASIALPAQVDLNAAMTVSLVLDNTSSNLQDTGYAPYFDVEAPPGIVLGEGRYDGAAVNPQLVGQFNASGQLVSLETGNPVTHPLTGLSVSGGTPGARLYTIALPEVLLSPSDTPLELALFALASKSQGATAGQNVALRVRGGFALGADSQNNSQSDPPLVGAAQMASAQIVDPLASATLNAQQVAASSFHLIWSRLSPTEALGILHDRGYLTRVPDQVPDDLRAYGLLDWLWFDKPLADGNLHYDTAVGDYRGQYLTTGPWNIVAQLEASFNSDKQGFLTEYFTAGRANGLTDQSAHTTAGQEATFRAMSWQDTLEGHTNILDTANLAWREQTGQVTQTPTQLKALTAGRPEGFKLVRLAGFEYAPLSINGGFATGYFDSEIRDHSFGAPDLWTDLWRQQMEPIWDNYWSQYKAAGGEVDWLIFDLERTPRLYDDPMPDAAYQQALFDDPRFPALLESMGFSAQTAAEFGNVVRGYQSDERAFAFHEIMQRRTAQDMNFLVSIVQRYFPNVRATEYNHSAKAPTTFTTGQSAKYFLSPLGTGSIVGTDSSLPIYGELRSTWMWGDTNSGNRQAAGAQYPNYPIPPDNQTAWNAFTYSMFRVRSANAATTNGVVTWLSYKEFNDPAVIQSSMGSPQSGLLYNSDLWSELVFHSALSGSSIMYWNRQGQYNDQPLHDALNELDQVVKYDGLQAFVGERINWNDPYIASRADVGGRIVWRVTPDPTLTTTVTTQGQNLVFRFGNQATLTIPRGQIVPGDSVSRNGFWVYQANAVPDLQLWTQETPAAQPGLGPEAGPSEIVSPTPPGPSAPGLPFGPSAPGLPLGPSAPGLPLGPAPSGPLSPATPPALAWENPGSSRWRAVVSAFETGRSATNYQAFNEYVARDDQFDALRPATTASGQAKGWVTQWKMLGQRSEQISWDNRTDHLAPKPTAGGTRHSGVVGRLSNPSTENGPSALVDSAARDRLTATEDHDVRTRLQTNHQHEPSHRAVEASALAAIESVEQALKIELSLDKFLARADARRLIIEDRPPSWATRNAREADLATLVEGLVALPGIRLDWRGAADRWREVPLRESAEPSSKLGAAETPEQAAAPEGEQAQQP